MGFFFSKDSLKNDGYEYFVKVQNYFEMSKLSSCTRFHKVKKKIVLLTRHVALKTRNGGRGHDPKVDRTI